MNKDQLSGRARAMGGQIKAMAAKLVGDKELELKGNAQQFVGRAQEQIGDIKQVAEDCPESIAVQVRP